MSDQVWRLTIDICSPNGSFQVFCGPRTANGFIDSWQEALEAGEPNQYLEIKGYTDTADRAPVRQVYRSGAIQAVTATCMTYLLEGRSE